MKPKSLLCTTLALGGALLAAKAEKRPNVIVFMADDMGYADVGFTGAKDIKTPNLDKLASNGVVFTNGHANHSFSGPSRAALMTGRYPYRFGFDTNPSYDPCNSYMGLDVNETLFPERMQKKGYKTAVIGKWHLGTSPEFHPNNRGFDYFFGFLGGGHDYFRIDMLKKVDEGYLQPLMRNNKPAEFDGYLTTALSQDAVKFVDKNHDKPFFLYLAYNAPHQPLQAPKEDIERYSFIENKKRRTYAAMVDVMDRGIGQVVDELKRHGIYEDTIIFFLSDNGGPQPNSNGMGGNASINLPYRAGKGSLFEGGHHVPFMMSYPAKIKSGIVYDYPVCALDISRTAVDMAGGDAMVAPAMEGVNLVPFVLGEQRGAPHEAIFIRGGKNWAMVTPDLHKYHNNDVLSAPKLYDLKSDVHEDNNLISKKKDLRERYEAMWQEWHKDNKPAAMIGYKDYHKKRDAFFEEARPKGAK